MGRQSFLIDLFSFCFRCLEMLLQVQWQKNFLISCSLLLKCHDWWWLRFDGEHQINPQVLHGAQIWGLCNFHCELHIGQNMMCCYPQKLCIHWNRVLHGDHAFFCFGLRERSRQLEFSCPEFRTLSSTTGQQAKTKEEWARLNPVIVGNRRACG